MLLVEHYLKMFHLVCIHKTHVPMCNYVYGIGGRDTTANDIESVYTDLIRNS